MKLDPADIEYAYIPATGAPLDAAELDVSFDGGATWHPATWNDDKSLASILVGGPDSAGSGDQVRLPLGENRLLGRLIDTPEVIIRSVRGTITVGAS